MQQLVIGRYRARVASSEKDVIAAQSLRHDAFIGGEGLDQDPFDDICTHILVEEIAGGRLVCCFRMLPLTRGAEISRSYSAQFYELSALEQFDGKMVEMGRFCVRSNMRDPDVLRVAWAAMTRYVDDNRVEMLFGCSSFTGTDADTYLDAFAMLKDRHLAPRRWLPALRPASGLRLARLSVKRRNT